MSEGLGTRCVHAGTGKDAATGALTTPITTATAFAFPNPTGKALYPRYFNVPSQEAVCRKLAALEGGEEALVFSSGMAAISTVLLGFLKAGDHAVFPQELYGGTHALARSGLARLGIETTFVPNGSLADLEKAIRPNTRLIYLESPSNPLLTVTDLAAVAALARPRGIPTAIDNTFATPVNQNPLGLGIDIAIHSGTKYLNGHSDVSCGAVITSAALIRPVLETAIQQGGTLDVRACYLLERGLKTLCLRVRQQNLTALTLANYLEGHPRVARVHYPGLESHRGHALARKQMKGFGGMLAFELKDGVAVRDILGRLRIITPAVSLGGVESLICLPAETSHVSLDPVERRKLGISDQLLRLSVGIEEAEDLRADLQRALA